MQGTRGEVTTTAVCLVPVGYRCQLNTVVRRHLDARRVSLAPTELAVSASGQEYGSIAPIGLPQSWPVLIAEQLSHSPTVIIGSGLRQAKLHVPFNALLKLTGGQVVPDLAA